MAMTNFDNLDAGNVVVNEAGVDKKKARQDEKKARVEKMKNLYNETIREDPTMSARLNTLSDKLIVVNTLGFGDSGNIVVDPKSESRALVSTSSIVGYRVKNIGDTPIEYTTEVFTKNEDGVFVGSMVSKTLAPGETADFTRKYMTSFCAVPEISFVLQNGKIVRGSSSNKNDIDAELEAYYFSFSDSNIKVNSDEIKLNVGTKMKQADGTTKWVVKPEFEEIFGYLNNAKDKSKRSRGKGGTSKEPYSVQRISANYIHKLLQKQANM